MKASSFWFLLGLICAFVIAATVGLSKTFKDAIIATRRLGFDYIWIDSSCTIQDDRVDWSIEAGTMGAVYSNSSLNLGAIDSPNSNTGLFF
jgi:hypothetical protein